MKDKKIQATRKFLNMALPPCESTCKRGLKHKTASEDMYQDSICNTLECGPSPKRAWSQIKPF